MTAQMTYGPGQESSPEIGELAKAMAKFQATVQTLMNTGQGNFQNRYVKFEDIVKGIQPYLAKEGLAFCQTNRPSATKVESVDIVTWLIHGDSGQWIRGCLTMPSMKAGPQGTCSAITYGRRYGLQSILGIAGDEDDDGEAAQQPFREAEARAKKNAEEIVAEMAACKTQGNLMLEWKITEKQPKFKELPKKWAQWVKDEVTRIGQELPKE